MKNLWKVFGPARGPDHRHARRRPAAPELLEKTGCVAAVKDVSFDVAPGEVFVVMGLSGSGKSTLVRCLTRLIEPTAGRSSSSDRDVAAMSTKELMEVRRNEVAMVFQHFGLLPHRRVIDNVAFGLEIRGEDKDKRYARAQEVIELVGLQGLREPLPRPALRRHAAARRAGPRAGGRPQGAAVRRAVLGARPADPPRHAERGDPAPGGPATPRWCSSPTTCRRRSSSATGS